MDGKIHEVDGVDVELVPRLKDESMVQEVQFRHSAY